MTVFSEFYLSAVNIKMDTYMQHINEMEGQYRQSELPRSKHRILPDVSHEQRERYVSFEGQESFVTFDQYSQSSREGCERQGYMPNREPISDVRSGNQVYDNRVPEKTGERVKPYSVPRSPCFEDIHNRGRVEEGRRVKPSTDFVKREYYGMPKGGVSFYDRFPGVARYDRVEPPSNTVGCTQDRSDPNIRSLQEEIGRSDRPHSPYLSRSRNVQNVQSPRNLRPPAYDGKSSFSDFVVQFELISQLSGWNLSIMALELASCLRGTAVSVLSELEIHERTHYPSLKQALANRFESGNLSQIYKAQLKSRVRKSEESIPELAQEISRLVRFAYSDLPSSLREGIAKDAFIEALSDRELELVVFQRHPKSLQEAVQVALEYDAFRTTRQKRTLGSVREVLSKDESDSYATLQDKVLDLERRLEGLRIMKSDNIDLCELGSETGNSKDRKSYKKCFSCGEVGHFKANCPTKVSGKVSQRNRVNAQCDYCGRMGHTMLKCWKYKSDQQNVEPTCVFCGMKGHYMIGCDKYRSQLPSGRGSNVRTVSMQGVTEAWIEGKTSTDICEAQEKDPYIGIVKAMIETDQRPKWVQIAHQNSVVKAYWSQWDRLVLRDDILYRKWWPTGNCNLVLQLVLPESLRGLALNQLHDQASSGHLGIRRTLA